jgi:hypothetical protein
MNEENNFIRNITPICLNTRSNRPESSLKDSIISCNPRWSSGEAAEGSYQWNQEENTIYWKNRLDVQK